MSPLAALAVWNVAVLGAAGLTWGRMRRHDKVYLLIAYSGAYLTGAFLILSRS